MKSYKQACGLAKALDVVGDRWSMLVIRELLIRGVCRYTDLRNGLPGIATNLLAERVRDLEAAGLIVREEAPPPVATTLYGLTERGRALEPALLLLGQWGAPLLAADEEEDNFQAHWMVLPLRLFLRDHRPLDPPVSFALKSGGEEIAIEVLNGGVAVGLGAVRQPAAIVSGPGEAVLGLMAGRTALPAAAANGLTISGDPKSLLRILPAARKKPAGNSRRHSV